jgi:transposase
LDLHRGQITFELADAASGEVWRGRLWSPDRQRVRRWLAEEVAPRAHGGQVEVAVEGCTGWRFVAEEITAAGFGVQVAEPAETMARRGRKRRAKTDRADAALLRQLVAAGDVPQSWIPPPIILEWRERVGLYMTLAEQRTAWVQRIHAECYQHGVAVPEAEIRSPTTRSWLGGATLELSAAARQRLATAYCMIDALDAQAQPLKKQLTVFGTHQPACRTLAATHYGIGGLLAVAIWSELGDCRRFTRSDQAVRHSGLDITVDQSDRRRAHGHLSRQGSPLLRWALFEAAKNSSRRTAPDHPYYAAVQDRHDGKIATLSIARKLARRCYHTLRALDPHQVYALP